MAVETLVFVLTVAFGAVSTAFALIGLLAVTGAVTFTACQRCGRLAMHGWTDDLAAVRCQACRHHSLALVLHHREA